MIRSFVAQAGTLVASAALAFLLVSPIAVSPTTAGTLSFPSNCTVTDSGGGNLTMSCQTTPGALSCFISGAPSTSITANTGVSLTMNCSGGTPPYQYVWSPGGGTGATLSTTVPATTTYSVTATDAANATATQSVTVTVGGGGGGGGGTGLCASYPNVMPTINAAWGQAGVWQSSQSGNFGNSIWVFKLTVPAGTPASAVTGRFTVSEYQGQSTFRQLTISTQACDFRTKDYTGVNGPLAVSNGTTASISYAVAAPFIFGPAGLTAGQTYYISVRNWQLDPKPQSSCLLTSCNAQMFDSPATP